MALRFDGTVVVACITTLGKKRKDKVQYVHYKLCVFGTENSEESSPMHLPQLLRSIRVWELGIVGETVTKAAKLMRRNDTNL